MQANWQLLVDMIKFNRECGDKTDKEVIDLFMNGYTVLNDYKDENGNINYEHAISKVNSLINQN